MFSQSQRVYDLIYNAKKDYQGESAKVADLIGRLHPDAKTILDVACGTGEHARHLSSEHGFSVDGLDLDPDLLEIAKHKNSNGQFFVGDMTAFSLQKKFDVIISLFSSIGYVETIDKLRAAIGCFREHLLDGGLLIIEPWYTPQSWKEGDVYLDTYQCSELKVARMGHSWLEENVSVLNLQYLVGSAEGITHKKEMHRLALFTVEEMTESLSATGFEVNYDPIGLSERGLYMARLVG